MVKDTYNKDKWDKFWRLYKTRRGARAYAKKHFGVWVIIDMNPELLSEKEKRMGLGTWLVGTMTEYLFYQGKGLENWEEYYPVVEIWEDGEVIKIFDE